MDFILLDIKNFLKKLENGQLEIEAGQWELHKDLTNMKLAVEELKCLKQDVEKMKLNSIQQMNLIKAVEKKIENLKQDRLNDRPVTVSERSVEIQKVCKRPFDRQASPKGYKKRKNHIIRSKEIFEITSQVSYERSEPELENSKAKEECSQRSAKSPLMESSYMIPSLSKSDSHCSYYQNNEILQRYLEDSAKYMDRQKVAKATETIHSNSKQNVSENGSSPSDKNGTSFWDEYGFRKAPKGVSDSPNSAEKEKFLESAEEQKSLISKRLVVGTNRSRKFSHRTDILKQEKNQKKAKATLYCKLCGKGFSSEERLKKHKAVHRAPSADSTGFKCSYCDQICSTPEKLTSHLRECRIIMRHHIRRK